MTGDRESLLLQALDLLLTARRTLTPIADLPANLQPADMDEVYFLQDKLAAAYAPIGGWKVGAATPDATPLFAPMPAAWMRSSTRPATASVTTGRYRGLEAEIAFLVGQDLPPRATPYTRDEVLAAIASCHPAIELLEPAFTDPTTVPRLASLADLQMHGGFIYGPAVPHWHSIDWSTEHVTLAIDGVLRVERTGSNTSGDLLKLLPWLANEAAARTGGLRAGQWITTGSWTGNTLATAGSTVEVLFSTAGRVDLRFS
jgi:2-keto-4-pentenoate hydratase